MNLSKELLIKKRLEFIKTFFKENYSQRTTVFEGGRQMNIELVTGELIKRIEADMDSPQVENRLLRLESIVSKLEV